MKKPSQRQQVLDQLKEARRVSRNWCLQNRITRLSALIHDLEAQGFIFNAHWEKTDHGKDYVYELLDTPKRMVSQVVEREGKYYEERVAVPLF
jgi:hypothetical protein